MSRHTSPHAPSRALNSSTAASAPSAVLPSVVGEDTEDSAAAAPVAAASDALSPEVLAARTAAIIASLGADPSAAMTRAIAAAAAADAAVRSAPQIPPSDPFSSAAPTPAATPHHANTGANGFGSFQQPPQRDDLRTPLVSGVVDSDNQTPPVVVVVPRHEIGNGNGASLVPPPAARGNSASHQTPDDDSARIDVKTAAAEPPAGPTVAAKIGTAIGAAAIGKTKKPHSYREEGYRYLAIDIILFLMQFYSEAGYAFMMKDNSAASVTDPVRRLCQKYDVTDASKKKAIENIGYAALALSAIDAIFTVTTGANTRANREELVDGIKTSIKALKENKIKPWHMAVNGILCGGTFAVGSLAPWAGIQYLIDLNRINPEFFPLNPAIQTLINHGGITLHGSLMAAGQGVMYVTSYAPFIPSGAEKIANSLKMSPVEWQTVKDNLKTTKGAKWVFSSAVSVVNRAWGFWGLAALVSDHVFRLENPYGMFFFKTFAAVCSGYQTFMSQGIKQYANTFKNDPIAASTALLLEITNKAQGISLSQAIDNLRATKGVNSDEYTKAMAAVTAVAAHLVKNEPTNRQNLSPQQKLDKVQEHLNHLKFEKLEKYIQMEKFRILKLRKLGLESHTKQFLSLQIPEGALAILALGVFIVRTLNVPSLWYGELQNPETQYGTKEIILTVLGLISGGFASTQYTQMMFGRAQDGLLAAYAPDVALFKQKVIDARGEENLVAECDDPEIFAQVDGEKSRLFFG